MIEWIFNRFRTIYWVIRNMALYRPHRLWCFIAHWNYKTDYRLHAGMLFADFWICNICNEHWPCAADDPHFGGAS